MLFCSFCLILFMVFGYYFGYIVWLWIYVYYDFWVLLGEVGYFLFYEFFEGFEECEYSDF